MKRGKYTSSPSSPPMLSNGSYIYHKRCVASEFTFKKPCSSSDGLAIYKHNTDKGVQYSGTCFACEQGFTNNTLARSSLADEIGVEMVEDNYQTYNKQKEETMETIIVPNEADKPKITKQQWQWLWKKAKIDTTNYRGISEEVYKLYKSPTVFDEDGNPLAHYYYVTENFKSSGFKKRLLPKDFSKGHLGRYGKYSDLFGMACVPRQGKYLLITSGEIDTMSAHQILNVGRDSKYDPISVVGGLVGEGTIDQQIRHNFSYLDGFENVIIAMDADEKGEEATQKILKALPKGKVKVMSMPLGCKDPNDALVKGREQQFIRNFYDAKIIIPEGVVASTSLEDKMKEYLSVERIGLPRFLKKLEDMLCGGFPLGYVVNFLAGSGIGKTTFANRLILHWIMNDSRKTGIVSLEASEGEYGVNLASAYCGFKVNLLRTAEERLEWLDQPENVEKRKHLWQDEQGNPRFYLLDGNVNSIRSRIEFLIIALGCKIIVLDPIQDLLDLMSDEQQIDFLAWEKDIVKQHMVSIIHINHARKSSQGQKANSRGADLSEEDMHGTGNLFKSGGINIILSRDKEAENPIERNITYIKITKARGVGNTGKAGAVYYVNETDTLWDREEYFEQNPEKLIH